MQNWRGKKGICPGVSRGPKLNPSKLGRERGMQCERKATFLEMLWHSQVLGLVTKNKHTAALRKHQVGRNFSNGLNQHLKLHWKQMTSQGWPQSTSPEHSLDSKHIWVLGANQCCGRPPFLHGSLGRGGGRSLGSWFCICLLKRQGQPAAPGEKSSPEQDSGFSLETWALKHTDHFFPQAASSLPHIISIYLDWGFASLPPSSQMLPFRDCVFL